MKATRTFIKNRKKVENPTISEQILGDKALKYAFSDFYMKYGDLLDVVKASHQLSYVDGTLFTREEYASFMAGLGVLEFFKTCNDEVMLEIKQEESRAMSDVDIAGDSSPN